MRAEDRYSRQILLPQVGESGQKKLAKITVAVVGLGALGCVSSDLLARAGVGNLRLVDRDIVELNNLQRQTLYGESDVGLPKALAAQERLRVVNSRIRVEGIAKDVNYRSAMAVLEGSDLVVDGTDNLETRYLLNDACIKLQIPLIYGAALGGEGMTAVLWPPTTACFRCLLPDPPPPGSLPTCETTGILNATASLVGTLQASQAMRFILQGVAEPELHVVDGWRPRLESLKVQPRQDCPACTNGLYEFLEASRRKVVAQLCGGDVVSVDPLLEDDIDLERLAKRLSKAGQVRLTPYLLAFEIPPYGMTIFPDGRALVKGTSSIEKASSLYSRYLGN